MGEKVMENVNKIYIVTSGEYSDYGIERVFLDETKARNYAKYHQAEAWGGMRVEEYGFADEGYELITAGYWRVTTIVEACKEHGPRPFFTKKLPTTLVHLAVTKEENKTALIPEGDPKADICGYMANLTIMITRYFPESMGEKKARAQTEKIAYDILAEINNHIVEGEDADDVIGLMEKKYEGN